MCRSFRSVNNKIVYHGEMSCDTLCAVIVALELLMNEKSKSNCEEDQPLTAANACDVTQLSRCGLAQRSLQFFSSHRFIRGPARAAFAHCHDEI